MCPAVLVGEQPAASAAKAKSPGPDTASLFVMSRFIGVSIRSLATHGSYATNRRNPVFPHAGEPTPGKEPARGWRNGLLAAGQH